LLAAHKQYNSGEWSIKGCNSLILHCFSYLFIDDFIKRLLPGSTNQKTHTKKLPPYDVNHLASFLHDVSNILNFLVKGLHCVASYEWTINRSLHGKTHYLGRSVLRCLLVFQYTFTFDFYYEVLGALIQNARINKWHISQKLGNESETDFLRPFIFNDWDSSLFYI
jgi:hypothetical protein